MKSNVPNKLSQEELLSWRQEYAAYEPTPADRQVVQNFLDRLERLMSLSISKRSRRRLTDHVRYE